MKSPIKDVIRKHNSHNVLRDLIPRGAVADSFLFFAGHTEFALTDYERFVVAHTTNKLVYEFWSCAQENARHLYDVVTSKPFKFKDARMFQALQEVWPTYPDPYVRSAFFFLLNRCSHTGFPSYGALDQQKFNPLVLSYLKNFKTPPNFHLKYHSEDDVLSLVKNSTREYMLIAPGSYKFNLFEYGKPRSFEETLFKHDDLHETLNNITNRKWVLVYNYHPRVIDLYEKHNITMVNKYSNVTTDKAQCTEVVVANF